MGMSMNTQSFIAQPGQQYTVGQPICRVKRRCDVVTADKLKYDYPINLCGMSKAK